MVETELYTAFASYGRAIFFSTTFKVTSDAADLMPPYPQTRDAKIFADKTAV